MNVPEPTTAKLVDKKTAAYEKQQAEVEEESRMKSLEQLVGTLMNNGKSSDTGEKEKDGDSLLIPTSKSPGSWMISMKLPKRRQAAIWKEKWTN